MELTIHPDAAANFDSRINELKTLLRLLPEVPKPEPPKENPNIHVSLARAEFL